MLIYSLTVFRYVVCSVLINRQTLLLNFGWMLNYNHLLQNKQSKTPKNLMLCLCFLYCTLPLCDCSCETWIGMKTWKLLTDRFNILWRAHVIGWTHLKSVSSTDKPTSPLWKTVSGDDDVIQGNLPLHVFVIDWISNAFNELTSSIIWPLLWALKLRENIHLLLFWLHDNTFTTLS